MILTGVMEATGQDETCLAESSSSFGRNSLTSVDIPMTKFWQNDSIVREQGIKEMHLVIKDNSGGSGHAHKRKDHEKFFPTKVRMTVIQVASGAKYDASLVPNLPPAKPKATTEK
jgi:hypothetical protein